MNEFLVYVKNMAAVLSFRSNRDDLIKLNSKFDTAIAIFCLFLLSNTINYGLSINNIVISTVIFGGLLYLSGPLFSNIFYLAGIGVNIVFFVLAFVLQLGSTIGAASLLFFVWQLIAYFVAMSKIQRG